MRLQVPVKPVIMMLFLGRLVHVVLPLLRYHRAAALAEFHDGMELLDFFFRH